MPDIYTVVIDGHELELEGDHPPTESDARAALQSYMATGARGLSGDPAAKEAERQRNMSSQAAALDADQAKGGVVGQMVDRSKRYLGGVVNGIIDPFRPGNLLRTGKDIMSIAQAPALYAAEQLRAAPEARQALVESATNLATGKPETWGNLTGQVATAALGPKLAGAVPNGMVRSGQALEAAGQSKFVKNAAHAAGTATAVGAGIGGHVGEAIIGGAAAEMVPPVMAGAGKMLQRGGRAMGGVSTRMPVPVKPNPNAGGKLVPGTPPVTTDEALAGVVQEANTPARPEVSVEPPPPTPLERVGRSMSGEEIAALQRRPGASPAPADMPVEAPVAETVAASTELPPAENISLIRQQLEASLKQAGLKSSDVPNPSRSRGGSGRGSGPSATKGYSRADLESIGLDPNTPLTRPLTERETAIVNAARQIRHEQHYGAAVSDAAAKRAVQRGRP